MFHLNVRASLFRGWFLCFAGIPEIMIG